MLTDDEAMPNKEIVAASFERSRAGVGSPFELLEEGANWTIVGSSTLSKTYPNRQAFLGEVITPFNTRMAPPLKPAIRRIYADGDTIVAFFDASTTTKDDQLYHNTYSCYFRMSGLNVFSATAFFDTREFDEFWNRVTPILKGVARSGSRAAPRICKTEVQHLRPSWRSREKPGYGFLT